MKIEYENGQLTEQEYRRLVADMIKKRGRSVLTIKKSNIIKPVSVEHVIPMMTIASEKMLDEPKAELDSQPVTTSKNTYRKDTQPDEFDYQTASKHMLPTRNYADIIIPQNMKTSTRYDNPESPRLASVVLKSATSLSVKPPLAIMAYS